MIFNQTRFRVNEILECIRRMVLGVAGISWPSISRRRLDLVCFLFCSSFWLKRASNFGPSDQRSFADDTQSPSQRYLDLYLAHWPSPSFFEFLFSSLKVRSVTGRYGSRSARSFALVALSMIAYILCWSFLLGSNFILPSWSSESTHRCALLLSSQTRGFTFGSRR